MQILIYLLTAILTSFTFSLEVTIIALTPIINAGDDTGSPGILLFVFLLIFSCLSMVVALIMGVAKIKFRKQFPAKISALIFLLTFTPFLIHNLYSVDEFMGLSLQKLDEPLMNLMFFSFIPLYHSVAQGFTNLYEWVIEKEKTGSKYYRYIALAVVVGVIFSLRWLLLLL